MQISYSNPENLPTMKLLIVLSLATFVAADPLPFIVGGQDATPGEYPWMGSLEFLADHYCGCVLIGEQWVLTAAHCVLFSIEYPNRFHVRLAVYDRSEDEGIQYEVTDIISHPFYEVDEPWSNDVALVRLQEPADLSHPWIDTIPLSSKNFDFPYTNCMITGWGRVCGGCELPYELQEAEMDVISHAECQSRWGNYDIGLSHICILDKETEARGACNGDSGGPLMCQYPDPELAGITSWLAVDCLTEYPSVYARVSIQCDWIYETSGIACMD